ncbi:IS66 family transposase [Caproicibacter fermentans]|nr:IS66 family transposase [Caproicibacter fermentans]
MEKSDLTAASATENQAEIAALKARVSELEVLVKYYEEQFRISKHRQYEASSEKSEYDLAQLSIFNEAELFADINVAEPELVEVEKHYRKRTRLTTDKLPENLPVEIVEHDLPECERICPECGGPLHVMGRDSWDELVIVPAQVKVRKHVRLVYTCRECEKDEYGVPIVKAAVSEPVIKGSFASPEAIAHIMTQKFVMGSPLYRQEKELQQNGIQLSRQTMSNWLIRATEDWLELVYEALHEMLCNHGVLHADETTLQVLREPGKTAQSKSYMWLYRTSGDAVQPIVLYDYQPDRRSKRPAAFLKDFKGYLHTDGYEGYHSLRSEITVVGCWAHVRRKFDESLKALPERDRESSNALRGKRYCDHLFELEREFSSLAPEERYVKRLAQSKPVLEEFFEWAVSLNAAPKTGIGIAVHYALSQRKYLEHYLLDGRLEISNNRAERSIKPFVVDRKNFLFANTPREAKASAVMFSLIETAKENGLNPFEYLVYILKNAPNWNIRDNPDALNLLMPDSARRSICATATSRTPA